MFFGAASILAGLSLLYVMPTYIVRKKEHNLFVSFDKESDEIIKTVKLGVFECADRIVDTAHTEYANLHEQHPMLAESLQVVGNERCTLTLIPVGSKWSLSLLCIIRGPVDCTHVDIASCVGANRGLRRQCAQSISVHTQGLHELNASGSQCKRKKSQACGTGTGTNVRKRNVPPVGNNGEGPGSVHNEGLTMGLQTFMLKFDFLIRVQRDVLITVKSPHCILRNLRYEPLYIGAYIANAVQWR
ncbi:hypothetical protein Tco_1198754 [Tanacetum coccineum]